MRACGAAGWSPLDTECETPRRRDLSSVAGAEATPPKNLASQLREHALLLVVVGMCALVFVVGIVNELTSSDKPNVSMWGGIEWMSVSDAMADESKPATLVFAYDLNDGVCALGLRDKVRVVESEVVDAHTEVIGLEDNTKIEVLSFLRRKIRCTQHRHCDVVVQTRVDAVRAVGSGSR